MQDVCVGDNFMRYTDDTTHIDYIWNEYGMLYLILKGHQKTKRFLRQRN